MPALPVKQFIRVLFQRLRRKILFRPGVVHYAMGSILVALIVAYQILLAPSRVEGFIKRIVDGSTDAKISLKVERASLIFGFHVRDLDISTKKDSIPIFRAKEIRLSVFLPSVFAGHIGIRELGLYRPEIYLIRSSDGRWNYEALIPPSPPKKKKTELPDTIRTYLPLKLYGDLRIHDLRLLYRSEERTTTRTLEIDHFNVMLAFITKTFAEIPLNVDLLDHFDTLVVGLNPFHPITLRYSEANDLEGEVTFNWILYREKGETQTEFLSRMQIDTNRIYLRKAGAMPLPLGFAFRYDTSYDAAKDRVFIHRMELRHGANPWVSLRATLDHATRSDRRLDLTVLESQIDLSAPGRLLTEVLKGGGPPVMEGIIHISSLHISGMMDDLRVDGNILANGVRIRTGKITHSLDDFFLNCNARLDLYGVLPLGGRPSPPKGSERLAFHLFHRLTLTELRGRYNGSYLHATASILPESGIQANITLQNLNVGQFSAPYFTGVAGLTLSLQSPESFEKIHFDGNASVRAARYTIQRSRSGDNNLNLTAAGDLNLTGAFVLLGIRELRLTDRNDEGDTLLDLSANGNLQFGNGQQYDVHINNIDIAYDKLRPTLPGSLQYTLSPYQTYLSRGVSLDSDLILRLGPEESSLRTTAKFRIPYLRMEDLQATVDIAWSDAKVLFRDVRFQVFRGSLNGKLTGMMERDREKGDWKPDLSAKISMDRPTLFRIHPNVSLQGSLNFQASMDSDRVRGALDVRDLDLLYENSGCRDTAGGGTPCHKWMVRGLNLDLPFLHDLHLKHQMEMSDTPYLFAQGIYGFRETPNLRIHSISSNTTPGGEVTPQNFYLLGSDRAGAPDGFGARIRYENNMAWIPWIDVGIYRRAMEDEGKLSEQPYGKIHASNIYFNLADLHPEHIEYGLTLKVKNLDLAPYLPGTGKNRISGTDGVISADLTAVGHNTSDPLYNTQIRLSVYRLSPRFSGFATRILMPNELVAWAANQTLKIPAIKIELKGGLVYSSVSIEQSGFVSISKIIRPSGDEIRQERIPLAQFLERARNEVDDLSRERRQ